MPAEIESSDPRSFDRAVEHQRERLGARHVAPGWAGFFRTIETAVVLGRDGGEVIDGVVVDETCSCGKPGRLVVDPYDEDVNNGHSMVVLCGDCEREAVADI